MKWLVVTSFVPMLTLAAAAPGMTQPPATSGPEAKVISSAVYKCDEGKSFSAVYFDNGTAQATFGSKVLMLDQIKAASGARYGDGSTTLYTKGNTAFVEVGSTTVFANCVAKTSVQGLW